MTKNGHIYGTSCDFTEYRIKAYNKTFEAKHTDKIYLKSNLFRWEIKVSNMRHLAKKLELPLDVSRLLTAKTLGILAEDAVKKFNNSIRVQNLHLNLFTAHEKLVIAALQNDEIRQDLKIHHKEAFRKYQKLYKGIAANHSICVSDPIESLLKLKFAMLIK